MDADDAVGEVVADELHQDPRLGFGEGSVAGLKREAGSGARTVGDGFVGPVGGGEVAVEVDVVRVEALARGEAVGVGDGDDDDGVAGEFGGMFAEPLAEGGDQRCAGGFVAVDGGDDQEHIGAVAVDFGDDGAAADGGAEGARFAGEGGRRRGEGVAVGSADGGAWKARAQRVRSVRGGRMEVEKVLVSASRTDV